MRSPGANYGEPANYAAVVAELRALHEARDWTPASKERFRQLCELERALRRRRKAAEHQLTA